MNRLKQLGLTLLALVSVSTQAVVKSYQYDDSDRLRKLETEPLKLLYQHDSAGNRNTKLIFNELSIPSHANVALDLAQTDLKNVDPNGETPLKLQLQLQGVDQKQLWQYMVSLYREGKTILRQAGSSVSQILLPILESDTKYDLTLEAQNAYHEKVVLESEIQTINHEPSKPSLSLTMLGKNFLFKWLSTDPDKLDHITYKLEALYSERDSKLIYEGSALSYSLSTKNNSVLNDAMSFRVIATDGKGASIPSDEVRLPISYIGFSNDQLLGFNFGHILEGWQRAQSFGESDEWVYEANPTHNPKQQSRFVTYFETSGGTLSFDYAFAAKGRNRRIHVLINGIPYGKYYADEAMQFKKFQGNLHKGAYRLEIEYFVNNPSGEDNSNAWIDNLQIPGIADKDQDGVMDGWEMKYFETLERDFSAGAGQEDSDNDGLTDQQEYDLLLNPMSTDSDRDGMPDQYEVDNGLNLHSNDIHEDLDQDGVNNITEMQENTDPTDPLDHRITFDNDQLLGFNFGHILEGWQRAQSFGESDEWVYEANPTHNPKQQSRFVTYFETSGGALSFDYAFAAKGRNRRIDVLINGIPYGKYYADEAMQFKKFQGNLHKGAYRLEIEYFVNNPSGEDNSNAWIDNLQIPGIADKDQDGVMDGWEMKYFETLERDFSAGAGQEDSDNDGLTDQQEYDLLLNPMSTDSDRDGMPDQYEVDNGLNLHSNDIHEDLDQDGVNNITEMQENTDPTDPLDHRITFDNDQLLGFNFGHISEGWQRAQSFGESNEWVYEANPTHNPKQRSRFVTYFETSGGTLSFDYAFAAKGRNRRIHVLINGIPYGKYYADEAMQFKKFQGNLHKGAYRLEIEYFVNNPSGEDNSNAWIDNLQIPGIADKDQDGVMDGWEMKYFETLERDFSAGAGQEDSDNDGLTDQQEYDLLLNPMSTDSDRDGMPDQYEVDNGLNLHSNDIHEDLDQDGVNNITEMQENTDPTDPLDHRITFDNDQLLGFNFGHISEGWQRAQSFGESNEWVYEANPTHNPKQRSRFVTYFETSGGTLSFDYAFAAKGRNRRIHVLINGIPYGKYYADEAMQFKKFQGNLHKGAYRLEIEYFVNNPSGEDNSNAWIDNLQIPGIADKDQDGVMDGWEMKYFETLERDFSAGAGQEDSDNDGLTDQQEYDLLLNPMSTDSDRDGMPDQYEVDNGLNLHSNDIHEDLDQDGVNNITEMQENTDPTDPLDHRITFDNDQLLGFNFGHISEGWQRAQSFGESNEWVYEANPTHNPKQQSRFVTYFETSGGTLSFDYAFAAKGRNRRIHVLINGIPYGKYYADEAMQFKKFQGNLHKGAYRLEIEYFVNNPSGEDNSNAWIDNLQIPGIADKDQDGVMDGWEMKYFETLERDFSAGAGQEDSDNDGLTDQQEYDLLLNPMSTDSDRDGMPDQYEVDNGFNLHSNDIHEDLDQDGVNNITEMQENTDPTDPLDHRITFDNDQLLGFNFGHILEGWQRAQSFGESDEWVYEANPTHNPKQQSRFVTYFETSGGALSFDYAFAAKGRNRRIDVLINGIPYGKYYADEAMQFKKFQYNLHKGAYRLEVEYFVNNPSGEDNSNAWIDNLQIPGIADKDQDGVMDGWEMKYFETLERDFSAGAGQEDSDNDGLTDQQEYDLLLNPMSTDSDRDGMPDQYEVDNGLNLHSNDIHEDLDQDGVNNITEMQENTDPTDPLDHRITFDNDQLLGFKFGHILEGWQRAQSFGESDEWVYEANPTHNPKQRSKFVTYFETSGGTLSFDYAFAAKGRNRGIHVLMNGRLYNTYYADEAMQFKKNRVNLSKGAYRLEIQYFVNNPSGEDNSNAWIDNLQIPGIADKDQDGVMDGWERKYFKTLERDFSAGAGQEDTDGDGVSDYEEYLNNTSPITANE